MFSFIFSFIKNQAQSKYCKINYRSYQQAMLMLILRDIVKVCTIIWKSFTLIVMNPNSKFACSRLSPIPV
ncbi:hypothetical protein GIB67_005819 [Kingdonia uniflora]|uniref:Uncharacterized protein n=1 Tax=Kingdonia uniflora TaxID=39325 RepID=A0A7J7LU20_9MAGN|nr:hypothetical protein GIB67_005819 [Kingdonia uniflora]